MKKKEIKILLIVAVIAVAAIIGVKWYQKANTPAETVQMVNITHDDKVVQTFDPNVNATYRIQGDYGTLDVEVKDGKWHVTNEECPNHICSQTGWVSTEDFLPIVCLPNNVTVQISESD